MTLKERSHRLQSRIGTIEIPRAQVATVNHLDCLRHLHPLTCRCCCSAVRRPARRRQVSSATDFSAGFLVPLRAVLPALALGLQVGRLRVSYSGQSLMGRHISDRCLCGMKCSRCLVDPLDLDCFSLTVSVFNSSHALTEAVQRQVGHYVPVCEFRGSLCCL